MAINIIDMIQGVVGPQIVSRIGSLLGEKEQNAGSAIGHAVPAILGGLINKGSNAGGAGELFNQLNDYDDGILDNLSGALSGGGHTSLIDMGMKLIGSLFGSRQNSLIGSLAKMAGIGQGSAGSLLGLLVPIVMGMLRKQTRAQNLDAGGLSRLLMDQKEHVARALPTELAQSAGLGDLLGDGAEAARTAATAVEHTTHAAARESKSLFGKLLPLIALLALAWLAWQFFGSSTRAPEQAVESSAAAINEIGGTLTNTLGDLTATLSGIHDVSSAEAAVSTIKGAASTIDGLGLNNLSSSAVQALSGSVGPLVAKLTSALDTVYAVPGVESILKPLLDPIVRQLMAFVS